MTAAEKRLRPQELRHVHWKTESVLPPPHARPTARELEAAIAKRDAPLVDRLLAAYRLGWLRRFARGEPFVLSLLRLDSVSVLHLPGEMFIEYQLRAQKIRPRHPVAVAAYGDDGLWYVPTKEEYPAGGYEVSVAFCRDDVDAIMTNAITRLLA